MLDYSLSMKKSGRMNIFSKLLCLNWKLILLILAVCAVGIVIPTSFATLFKFNNCPILLANAVINFKKLNVSPTCVKFLTSLSIYVFTYVE